MSDDRILVVGGNAGIGAGIVAEYGSRCIVWSRSGGVDAADPVQVEAAARLLETPYALVHCVGDFEEAPLLTTELALYTHLLRSNLTSAFVVARQIVPKMVAARRGRVIFFAAAGADSQRAKLRAPVYFAIKAALLSLARSLALEIADSGVTVNVLSPGVIRHPSSHVPSQQRLAGKIPIGRAGQVNDLLGAVRLLLSQDGSYITGANLTVDGGLALM